MVFRVMIRSCDKCIQKVSGVIISISFIACPRLNLWALTTQRQRMHIHMCPVCWKKSSVGTFDDFQSTTFPWSFCLPAFRPYMGYQRCLLVEDLLKTSDLYWAQKRQREKAITYLLKVTHFQQPILCTTLKHKSLVWTPLNSPIAALNIKDTLLVKLNHL
jgi:hypothetical protein